MMTPTRWSSVPTCIRKGKRLIRITQPIPEIPELVATYEGAVTSLENRYDGWSAAVQQASVALATQREAVAALDEEIRGVGLAIVKASRGRRTSSTYHDYFPRGYGRSLRRTPDQAMQTAAGLIASMADETNPAILAFREPLEAARAKLAQAITARQAAEEARSQARAVLEKEKTAWRDAHNDFYFAVRSRFPDRRRWVEALFRMPGQYSADEEEQPAAPGEVDPKTDEPARPDNTDPQSIHPPKG